MTKFKFLAGEHIGAVLDLPQGEHLLGNTPDCLLQTGGLEDGAEPTALLVTVSPADELSITLKQGQAVLDGQALTVDSTVSWTLGQILSFGFTALTPYKEGMDFAALDLSVLGFAKAAEEKKDTEPEIKPETAAEPAPLAEQAESAAVVEKAAESDAEAVFAEQKKPGPARIVWLVAGLIVLALLLSSLVAGSYLYGSRSEHRALLSTAEEYVQQAGFDGIKAEFDGRSIVFSGTLSNRAALSAFINGLPPLSCSVIFDLTLADDELKALEDAFAVQGAAVRASIADDGRLKVSGYIKDPYVERALLERVLPSFSELGDIAFDFHYAPELIEELEAQSAAQELNLTFEPDNYAVNYDGALTYPESQKLSALQQELERKFSMPLVLQDKKIANRGLISHLTTQNAVIAGAPSTAALQGGGNYGSYGGGFAAGDAAAGSDSSAPAALKRFDPGRVVGVTMQPLRFITMDSGEKFFEGAMLPGGALLKEIHLDYLVVENHGRSTTYELK